MLLSLNAASNKISPLRSVWLSVNLRYNVVPLLVFRPNLALGLDERVKKLETCLIAVVPDLVLEIALEKVETCH